MHDFAAKIACGYLQAMATDTALPSAALPATRRINRAAAHAILKQIQAVHRSSKTAQVHEL